jgi:hypothetical protein
VQDNVHPDTDSGGMLIQCNPFMVDYAGKLSLECNRVLPFSVTCAVVGKKAGRLHMYLLLFKVTDM